MPALDQKREPLFSTPAILHITAFHGDKLAYAHCRNFRGTGRYDIMLRKKKTTGVNNNEGKMQ
jgi:hypothetical protein